MIVRAGRRLCARGIGARERRCGRSDPFSRRAGELSQRELPLSHACNAARSPRRLHHRSTRRSGAKAPQLSSMCCPIFRLRPTLPAGTLWRGQQRFNIPGSTWLPDTGYGELSPAADGYLKTGLERITGGDRAKPLVIYCLRDCWMSWNAAKRAVIWGYTGVIWYPEGTDGWQDAGLPLEEAKPAPHPGE